MVLRRLNIGWKKFTVRIKIVWAILTNRKPHWVIIMLSREDLVDLLQEDEDFWPEVYHHGLQRYNVMQIIDRIREGIDDADLVLEKARFEAMAEESLREDKNK